MTLLNNRLIIWYYNIPCFIISYTSQVLLVNHTEVILRLMTSFSVLIVLQTVAVYSRQQFLVKTISSLVNQMDSAYQKALVVMEHVTVKMVQTKVDVVEGPLANKLVRMLLLIYFWYTWLFQKEIISFISMIIDFFLEFPGSLPWISSRFYQEFSRKYFALKSTRFILYYLEFAINTSKGGLRFFSGNAYAINSKFMRNIFSSSYWWSVLWKNVRQTKILNNILAIMSLSNR